MTQLFVGYTCNNKTLKKKISKYNTIRMPLLYMSTFDTTTKFSEDPKFNISHIFIVQITKLAEYIKSS